MNAGLLGACTSQAAAVTTAALGTTAVVFTLRNMKAFRVSSGYGIALFIRY